jgi:hypothetical protein
MQDAAAQYFDRVAERFDLDASDRVIVTGHSKGGTALNTSRLGQTTRIWLTYAIRWMGKVSPLRRLRHSRHGGAMITKIN